MAGTVGATSQGNATLIKHGIAEDESDYRLHVSFAFGKAYLFPTPAGQAVLENGKTYPEFRAKQPGVNFVTGRGYKVPWQDIPDCQELLIPPDVLGQVQCRKSDGPSAKGRKAVTVAQEMLKQGLVPLPTAGREIHDHDMQLRGKDIIVTYHLSLQIKCDWWAAKYGLALQTMECNPLRRY